MNAKSVGTRLQHPLLRPRPAFRCCRIQQMTRAHLWPVLTSSALACNHCCCGGPNQSAVMAGGRGGRQAIQHSPATTAVAG